MTDIIPVLSDEAVALSQRMDLEPKNEHGIPQTTLKPNDRPALEFLDEWLRAVNSHLMDFFRAAEAASPRGSHLTSLPAYDDKHEQKALMSRVKEMSAKSAGVNRYPHDPAHVLELHELIEHLRGLITVKEETEEEPVAALTVEQQLADHEARLLALEERN